MLEILLPAAVALIGTVLGFAAGVDWTNTKNRRENAATASCVGCDWTSGPVPLSEAFRAAQAHREGMKHHSLVERAQ